MARDFVLEIGTEEIPAKFMPGALNQLRELAEKALKDIRLEFENITTFGTPRRLSLYITGLEEKAQDIEVEAKGPSKKVAFDGEGNPSKAALGFARGQGVDINDLVVKEFNGVEYVYALKTELGKKAVDILPQLSVELVNSLNFPKPMKWGYNEMRFARPIRWLLALYGEEVVKFELAGLESGAVTRGHRFIGEQEFAITNSSEYVSLLKEKGMVMVDQQERKDVIWQQILELAKHNGGQVEEDEDLLEEVVYLVEYPTALIGSFEDHYLQLPKEVLITPMKEHQRYFPVLDAEGNLLNRFITVRNGGSDHLEIVAEGNEKVLKARLADAEFFYREDLKKPLADYVANLKNIVFQDSLGTVYHKVERIRALSGKMAEKLAVDSATAETADRGAYLAKADLVTNMVYEFTELQGIMGEKYAVLTGETPQVGQVIFEHYLPRFSGDVLPESLAGTIVSIADKMDTITGCFAVGIQPTGSQDPYALRRQALGVCYMIMAKGLNISLSQLIEWSYTGFGDEAKFVLDLNQVRNDISEFFKLRLKNIFMDQQIKYDTVEAVLAAGFDDFVDTSRRMQALNDFRDNVQFQPLLQAYTRVNNLAKKAEVDMVFEADILVEDSEKQLATEFFKVREEAAGLAQMGDYVQWLEKAGSLRPLIDEFFDGVMVMVEDEKLKAARLSLLASITEFFNSVADLSKIAE